MTTINKFLKNAGKAIILAAVMANAHGAITAISQTPLVTSSSTNQPVKPNVFLMMDDSGSMAWDYMPDDATNFSNQYGFNSSQCNGIYYDPAITHTAPVKADGTSYPDATFTAAWVDGYNTGSGTTNLNTSFSTSGSAAAPAFYYAYSGTQTTNALKNYANTNSTFYKECNSAIGAAPGNAVFTKYKLATTETTTITVNSSTAKATFTITVAGGVSTPVSSITVGGTTITSGTSTGSTTNSTEASNLANKITSNSYTASATSNVITVTGPASAGSSVVITKSSGTDTFTVSAISPISVVSSIMVGSTQLLLSGSAAIGSSTSTTATNIAAKINAVSYTASASGNVVTITGPTSAANYTPALTYSGTMTYTTDVFPDTTAAKLTNFANWYSYYSIRINMMKTATGLAFKTIDSNYRVGFATMNNNGGTDFLNLAPFVNTTSPLSTQRTDFYAKLYGTSPGSSTPLLSALSSVGLMYAHKLPSNKLNTLTANDPIQYSCQQNFTILSTDGYWNDATNMTLSAQPGSSCSPSTGPSTTAVGNCDGPEVRPMFDGATNTTKTATPTTTVVRKQTVTNQTADTTWKRTVKTTAATKGTGGCSSSKYLVTTQPQTYDQLINSTVTSVNDYTTTVTSTVTCINGLCGAPVNTTVGPTSSNVSSNTVTNSDTGAPTGSTTWSNSSTSTSCSSSPSPAAGTSSTSSTTSGGTTTTVIGTPVVTTLSTTSTVGTPVVTVNSSGGTSNTLSDVAEYYYVTDIRDASLANATGALGTNVTLNNVPTSGLDAASWQHMTTFTLGLGARGSMVFSPTYQTDSSGDFFAVKNGSLANSTTGVCSWQANGTVCNWPVPPTGGGDLTTIDDLWHAAVDGRGAYYSATSPSSLSTGLSTTLKGIKSITGSSASASVSNPNITSVDNFIFSSQFVSQDWDGQLIRQQLDLTTGALSATIDWDAGALLDTNSARNIYAFNAIATNGLQTFNSTNFGSNANFTTPHISSLSQLCVTGTSCLTAAQQTAAAGANLVAYLAGDRTNEGYPADLTMYYRQRLHLLGDIVDSQATYVKAPLLLYSDSGYSAYVTAKAKRQSMIYVGANDGMLHAFYASSDLMDNVTGDVVTTGGVAVTGGAEAWAFIPTAVMPNLYKLADINYSSNHQYFVDGSPLATDICPTTPALQCSGTTWKTILVGGLNAGGNSYFAMDITNPAAPKALWEFTNANLGYSYGNPQVVKLGGTGTGSLAAGTWVVLLTSGYNNADGMGHLFVLNAYTGALLLDISTGQGSAATPSGLSRIIAQVVNPSLDATVLQVYGGDLLGYLWRFDVNGNVGATGYDAQLLAVLTGPTGLAQPITSKPEVGLINGEVVVDVGTGRYLGGSDIDGTDTTQISPNLQTMYGIMDPLLTTTTPSVAIYPNPRTLTTNPFVQQTEFNTTCPLGAPATLCTFGQIVRTSTHNAVSIPANSGWYVDFPDSGERLTTDPMLELGMLAFNTNVPLVSACTIGGNSYNYVLDYTTGSFLLNSVATITAAMAATLPASMVTLTNGVYTMGIVAGQHTGSLSTAGIFIRLPNGSELICTNDSTGVLICRPVNPPPPPGGARRVSWRQLLSQ